MPRLPLALALLLLACPSNDTADDTTTTQTTDQDTSTSDDTNTNADPVCIAGGGSYGSCNEQLCQCVLGGDLYQYCTKPCTDTAECGDPAEFPGATPACEPVNPGDPGGDPNMICVLRCATTADCPCGLECEPTYLLCSEPQP